MYRTLSTITLAVAVILSSCTSGTTNETSSNVKHFRHLQFSETAYDKINGIYPLTADEAKSVNNWTFTYNKQGKPVSIAYMRGDNLLGYSGRSYARLEITYTDSTEVQHFFNAKNEPVNSNGVYAYVYQLDKNGNRTGLSFLDKEGNKVENRNKIAWYTWEVLPDGMVKENRYNMENVEVVMNPNCPFFELRFSYDPKGFCTRMANYMDDTLYNCTAENCGDIGVSYFTFDYNDKGSLTDFAVYNVYAQRANLYAGWSHYRNTVDENGDVVESFFWDQDNEPIGGRRNPITVTKYDKHGAVIEQQYMDENRQLVINPGINAAVIRYTYDEDGMPVDTTLLDAAMVEVPRKEKT